MSAPRTGTVVDPDELDEQEGDELDPKKGQQTEEEEITQTEEGEEGEEEGGEKKKESTPEMAEALADLARSQKVLFEHVTKKEEVKQKQRTPEEEAEHWGIFDPEKEDKDFLKKFFRLGADATSEEIEQARNAFAAVQRGLVKQSITGSTRALEAALEKLQSEYNPLKEFVEEIRVERLRDRFFKTYPALNKPAYEKILNASYKSVQEQSFDNEKEFFKALAEGAADAIKGILPEFDLGKPSTTTGKAPKLPRTNVGGGGGAGNGRDSTTFHRKDQSAEIFED